jgi:DNA-binding transcriptional MerR regulator
MYTIGQVSKMFNLPISTLRYYDKEGLFPEIQRASGIRKFNDKEIDSLHVIECLKKSGMEIKDIKQFMEWCSLGSETYPQRKELFITQKKAVEAEIRRMNRILAMLRYKCWYYEEAIKDGNEDRLNEMLPDKLPKEIQVLYDHGHEMV